MNTSRLLSGLILLSVACGSRFEATPSAGDTSGAGSGDATDAGGVGNTSGGADAAGSAGAGSSTGFAAGAGGRAGGHGGSTGTGHAGAANNGGTAGSMIGIGGSGLGGQVGLGGASGGVGVAGSVGSSGASGTAGAVGGGAGGAAGAPNGGTAGAGGSAGSNCSALQSTYLADLDKARVCNLNAVKVECSIDSTLPSSCQCPVLVASGTPATAKAKVDLKAFTDAGCTLLTCGVACVQYPGAVCAAASGSTVTVCSGAVAVP